MQEFAMKKNLENWLWRYAVHVPAEHYISD